VTRICARQQKFINGIKMTHLTVNDDVSGTKRKERHCQTGKKVVERHDRNLEFETQFFDYFSLF